MSFVDLMASDIWSDADITRRTEAMVRGQFSDEAERIINRKLQAAVLGIGKLSDAEKAEIARFEHVAREAQEAGAAARADMALLREVLAVEPAFLRLRRAPVEPVLDELGEVSNQSELDQDAASRAEAQAVVDGAAEEVIALVRRRNPVPAETAGEAEAIEGAE